MIMERKRYGTWLSPSPDRNARSSLQPRTSRWRSLTCNIRTEDQQEETASSASDAGQDSEVSCNGAQREQTTTADQLQEGESGSQTSDAFSFSSRDSSPSTLDNPQSTDEDRYEIHNSDHLPECNMNDDDHVHKFETQSQTSDEFSSSSGELSFSSLDRLDGFNMCLHEGQIDNNDDHHLNKFETRSQTSDKSTSSDGDFSFSSLDRLDGFNMCPHEEQIDNNDDHHLNEFETRSQTSDESTSSDGDFSFSSLDRLDGFNMCPHGEQIDNYHEDHLHEFETRSQGTDVSSSSRGEDYNEEHMWQNADGDHLLGDEASSEERESDGSDSEDQGTDRNAPFFADVYEVLKMKLTTMFSEVVQAQPRISPAELLLNALTHVQACNFNFSQFEGTMKLINSIFKECIVPDTRYKLDALLKSLSGMHYYFVCMHCFSLLGELNHKVVKSVDCGNCNTTNVISDLNKCLFFVMFDLPPQIEVLLSDETVLQKLKNPRDLLNNDEAPLIMKDVYQGKMYQEFILSLDRNSDIIHISLCFSVDGVALYRNSSTEVWPLFCSILELPPFERAHNLLLGGLWFGKKHVIQDLFLAPFVQHCNKLSTDGFKIMLKNEEKLMKAHCLCCCADAPARASVQCLHQHGGAFSCNWCLHPAEGRLYKTLDYEPQKRTREQMLADGTAVLQIDVGVRPHINGVTGISPILSLPSMDIVKGMVLEYFHACAHGIAKTMIGGWLGDDGCDVKVVPYYIGKPSNIKLIDAHIKSIKLPVEGRNPARLISDVEHWKGRDYENFILYLSVPVLLNILPGRYLVHWTLFVQALHLLLQDETPEEDLATAKTLLIRFSNEMEVLYPERYMTYNLHIVCFHLPEKCEDWGPLFGINGYCFEGGNKELKSKVRANLGIPSQVCRSISHEKARKVLKTEIGNAATEKFENDIKKNVINSCVFIGKDKYYGVGKKFVPTSQETFIFNRKGLDTESFVVKHRLVHDGCVYSAVTKNTSSHDNSVALLKDNRFVIIENIIVSEQENKGFLICKKIICDPFFVPHGLQKEKGFLKKIRFMNREPILLESSMLRISCCRMHLSHGDFFVKVPNVFNTS